MKPGDEHRQLLSPLRFSLTTAVPVATEPTLDQNTNPNRGQAQVKASKANSSPTDLSQFPQKHIFNRKKKKALSTVWEQPSLCVWYGNINADLGFNFPCIVFIVWFVFFFFFFPSFYFNCAIAPRWYLEAFSQLTRNPHWRRERKEEKRGTEDPGSVKGAGPVMETSALGFPGKWEPALKGHAAELS